MAIEIHGTQESLEGLCKLLFTPAQLGAAAQKQRDAELAQARSASKELQAAKLALALAKLAE